MLKIEFGEQFKSIPLFCLVSSWFYDFIFLHTTSYKTLNETTTECLGGDDLLGLKITEKDANVAVGDVIVGRESGPFLGKVI